MSDPMQTKSAEERLWVTIAVHPDEDTGIPQISAYGPFAAKCKAEADARAAKGFAKYIVVRRIISPEEYRDDG